MLEKAKTSAMWFMDAMAEAARAIEEKEKEKKKTLGP
jgi:hypothetical protein